MNRRFVDLPPPGYQQNDDSSDTKESIIQLLEQEREKESMVLVCVEEDFLPRTFNFVSSSLGF
jgi:hypothetical protein